jgi:hypothetical protein
MRTSPLKRAILILGIVGAFALPASAGQQSSPQEAQKYYLRIKQVQTKPQPSFNPPGAEITLNFGDVVSFVRKHEVPNLWLVSRDGKEVWIHACYLTGDTNELEFLKENSRIPSEMAYLFIKDGEIMIQGRFAQRASVSFDNVLQPGGKLNMPSGPRVNFVSVGDALMVDPSVVKNRPKRFWVIGSGDSTFDPDPQVIYYCTAVEQDLSSRFECIDLRKISPSACKNVKREGSEIPKVRK